MRNEIYHKGETIYFRNISDSLLEQDRSCPSETELNTTRGRRWLDCQARGRDGGEEIWARTLGTTTLTESQVRSDHGNATGAGAASTVR